LQQVGAHAFVGAAPVEPLRLPVPIPRTARALVSLNHVWVLHRRAIVRMLLGVGVLLALGGLYEARDAVAAAGAKAYRLVQGEFAQAGFGIDAIQISGQSLTPDKDIVTMLTVGTGSSTITFDAQKAQARLEWLASVKSASVRKVYPNKVIVSIVEKVPVVRWRVGDVTWLIDAEGDRIGTDVGSYTELPLVVGHGAADDAVAMVRVLGRHPQLMDGLAALSRIGDRRWDLIYRDGLRVQLPETGVAQALDRLDMYQRDYQLLDRDVTQVDLRVAGFVALKPGELATKQLADYRKKNKHVAKESADYATGAEKAAGNTTGTH
jgi:cell division protein FtsQ